MAHVEKQPDLLGIGSLEQRLDLGPAGGELLGVIVVGQADTSGVAMPGQSIDRFDLRLDGILVEPSVVSTLPWPLSARCAAPSAAAPVTMVSICSTGNPSPTCGP
jgi:hypothetical protein